MTTVSTIGSAGGRNYATVALWEAAIPATPTGGYEGDCYNDSEFLVAGTLVTFSGHTTSAANFITLTTGAGQSFRDNTNVQTNKLVYNQSNGVGLRVTGGYSGAIHISDSFVTLSNLQIKSSANGSTVITQDSGTNLTIDYCIIHEAGNDLAMDMSGNSTCKIRNSLVYSEATGLADMFHYIGGFSSYFTTFVAASNIASPPTHILGTFYVSCIFENCAAFGGGTTLSHDNTMVNATTCMTDATTVPAGFTGSKTYANQFQGVTLAAADFREKTGADLHGAGTSDSTNGATDIAGTTRPQGGNWDIGCWELVAAGGAKPPPELNLIGVGQYLRPAIAIHMLRSLIDNKMLRRRGFFNLLRWR